MLTSSSIIFYIAFLGQIYLLSWYFPGKILERMRTVQETYPPAEYPRLYPSSDNQYAVGYRRFKLASRIIFALGFVILFMIMFVVDHSTFADDGFISEIFPGVYGMIQFLPLMALEISEYKQFEQMRKANVTTTRKADMRRRGLFNFVSPALFGITVALFASAVLLDLYANQFIVSLNRDVGERILILTLTNLLLAGIGVWLMYGKKLNPHQTADDRAKHIKTSLHSFLYVSMALSVYWMTQAADDMYNLDFLDAAIMSVYFQAIAALSIGTLLRNTKLEDIDFEVYRDSPAAS